MMMAPRGSVWGPKGEGSEHGDLIALFQFSRPTGSCWTRLIGYAEAACPGKRSGVKAKPTLRHETSDILALAPLFEQDHSAYLNAAYNMYEAGSTKRLDVEATVPQEGGRRQHAAGLGIRIHH